jgi:hypothetical protein
MLGVRQRCRSPERPAMSRTKLSSSLMVAAMLAATAGAGMLHGKAMTSASSGTRRRQEPKKHATEIEQWNADVEARKAAKKARKNGGQQ